MDFNQARLNMVEGQIKPNKVVDKKLIDVLRSLPKENFLPEGLRSKAYSDNPLEIVKGRYLLSPVIFARMVQAVALKSTDIVLDVGALTGYTTVVLSQFAEMVIGVESDKTLFNMAEEVLQGDAYCNIVIYLENFSRGLEMQSPYDVIFINGAVSKVPSCLFDQLKESGRLICVEKTGKSVFQAVLYTKNNDVIGRELLFDAVTPYLIGFEPLDEFSL